MVLIRPDTLRVCTFMMSAAVLYAVPGGYQALITNTVQPTLEEFVAENFKTDTASDSVVWFISATAVGYSIGCIFGSSASSYLGERLGPFRSLQYVVAPIYIFSSILLSVSFVVKSNWLLLCGRICYGLGGGVSNVLINVYVAECSPAKYRGLLIAAVKVTLAFGSLFAQIMSLSSILGNRDRIWLLFALPIIVGILGVVAGFLFPETPAFWVRKDDLLKARHCVRRLMGPSVTESDIDKIIHGIQTKKAASPKSEDISRQLTWTEIFTLPKYRRPFLMANLLNMSLVFIGQPLTLYSTEIFLTYGNVSQSTAQYLTIFINVVNNLAYIGSVPLVHLLLRRPLFISGEALGVCTHIGLVFVPFITNDFIQTAFFTALWLIFTVIKDISVAPLRSLLPLELCQTELRVKAFSVSTVAARIMQTTTMFAFYPLFKVVGSYIFLFFALTCFIILVYVTLYLPETYSLTFHEISKYWENDNSKLSDMGRRWSTVSTTVHPEKLKHDNEKRHGTENN